MAKAKLNYQKIRSPKKCFINIQNIDDNECLKCCLVRYLYPADHNPDKDFAKELDFKDIMLPVKIKYINCIDISFFGYKNEEKNPIYKSKK